METKEKIECEDAVTLHPQIETPQIWFTSVKRERERAKNDLSFKGMTLRGHGTLSLVVGGKQN
jgi:hypothetical protein